MMILLKVVRMIFRSICWKCQYICCMLYCLCELAVLLVTMAIQWSLATHANRVSAMVTASTPMVESCVTVRLESVCHALATLKAHTVNAVGVDITGPQ